MIAAVLYGPNDLRIEEVETPQCGEDELLIRVKAVGLCGSDIRTIFNGHKRIAYPQILGHEITGEIVEVGSNVKKYQQGERIYVSPTVPCFECSPCKRGWYCQCENLTVPGTTMPGGFAEYMVITKDIMERGQIIPIPEKMSYEDAVMTEPLSSVYACQENADVTLGDTVVVIGTGPIGCLHVELAKLRGAIRVIAIDQLDARLQIVKQFGADDIINSKNEDPVARVKEITAGYGADKIISANPSTEAQQQAIVMAAKRGKVVFFGGVAPGKLTEIDTNIVHYNQLMLLGHFGYDHLQNYKSFALIASGRLAAKKYVTHVLPLAEIKKGIELTKSGEAIKVVLQP
ncbi:MAG: alcohol dehydrogenase catalytic domain-containing protein [Clostridia bacterium]|nr:alcohol dehydrogenase catalytic domain-containing protein [Clostridia bacterium]